MVRQPGNNKERVYKKILVPLDGSDSAESVLEIAENLAARSGAVLTLLHVNSPHEPGYDRLYASYMEQVAERTQLKITRMCQTTECHFEGLTATAMPALVNGEPGEQIVRYAEENDASVILMATHGRSRMARVVMTDIANRVLRSTSRPVWLIRTLGPDEIVCAEWPPKRVLVPLDGSERAERVLPYATQYARLFDSELVLMRVCENPAINADYPEAKLEISWDEHLKRIRNIYQGQCSIYLETVKDRLEQAGIKVTLESMLGNAAEEIIKYIRNNRCDLVAMTTYGRSAVTQRLAESAVGRLVFSNVTEQVIAATSRGILVAR